MQIHMIIEFSINFFLSKHLIAKQQFTRQFQYKFIVEINKKYNS